MELLERQHKILKSIVKGNVNDEMKVIYESKNNDCIAMNYVNILGQGDYKKISNNVCNKVFDKLLNKVFSNENNLNTYILPVDQIIKNIKDLHLDLRKKWINPLDVVFRKNGLLIRYGNNIVYDSSINDNLVGKTNTENKCCLDIKQFLKVLNMTTAKTIYMNTTGEILTPYIFTDSEKYIGKGMFAMITKCRN